MSLSVYSQRQYTQSKANSIYVDPFIGTTKSNVLTSWGGNGGTYPGAVAPSGNIQLTPETRVTGAKGYDYSDQQIFFFSCFKHFSGFPEGSSGQVFILPVEKGKNFEPGKYNRPFSHTQEEATPGYYKVVFTDNNTIAEAAASTRTGILKFTFPAKVAPQIYIGEAGDISLKSKRVVHGSLGNTTINLSSNITESDVVKGGYLLSFEKSDTSAQIITLKISSSSVSFEGAQQNIETEIGQIDFEAFRERTAKEWDTQLATVDIKDPSTANKKVFYTALYHSLLIPWVISDVDGKYKGADGKTYQTKRKNQYGGFSPWDTFRSLHPLLTLLYPEKQNDVILSMLDVYEQSGYLPTETMTGNHAVPIIVDAYLKGITGYDKNLAYKAMKNSIVDGPFSKNDMEIYHQLGYVPFSKSESVTRTMEYAYDDWALLQFAKLVMKNKPDQQLLETRGLNYRNIFHPSDLFMLPRLGIQFKLNPGMTGYKEGNKWVYTYFVPHNAKDLINLLGGPQVFSNRLDSAMANNVILYDNETVLHLPYLFNAAGRPTLTQQWLRNIMLNRFSATPGGLPGNDDLGSMSSAYIFNAIGLFPISPGNPLYAIGAPLFESVTLHLFNKKDLEIHAENQSAKNKYIHALSINNHSYNQLDISHEMLMKGGRLNFVMSPDVKQAWPTDRDPISLSATKINANIKLLHSSISSKRVRPDEAFQIKFTLKNEGSLGTKRIIVYADGKPWLSKFCLVPQGLTITDSISGRLYKLGKVKIGTNTSTATVINVINPVKHVEQPFLISGLNVKPILKLNTQQEITYRIKNITGTAQTFKPNVILSRDSNNKKILLYTDQVYLLPGQQKTINHRFTVNRTGLQTIKTGNMQAIFKVYDTPSTALLLNLEFENLKNNQVVDQSGFKNNALLISGANDSKKYNTEIGDSTYLEIPNAPSLDQIGNSLSMMAWVYPTGEEKGLTDIITKGDSHVIQTTDNKTLTFFAGGWGRGDCTVKLPANWKNNWHHIAGVCEGDLLSIYLDGKLAGSTKVDGVSNLSNTSRWQIGRNEEFPSERIFHGQIDLIKIYGEPLLAKEIEVVFQKEKSKY
ncbi:GH92 family glycosyl hydrolase [Pedobacter jejuensis]|uniref:GH92 family glycosyl hydrolase n=1 Tax=Pedobacter jejuensis TaxID=1268550 RepID=UPI00142D3EE9|nr:GH92 family glycosyl hydrolase [Pedobacter jejuensis]